MASVDAQGNIVISPAEIRLLFPEFADTTKYSDARIQAALVLAGGYISTANRGDIGFERRVLLIELMACHFIKINDAATGASSQQISGMPVSATIGKVTVSVAIPKNLDELHYFLMQTTYGQQYAAMLKALCTPKYFGGSRERLL